MHAENLGSGSMLVGKNGNQTLSVDDYHCIEAGIYRKVLDMKNECSNACS